MIRDIPSIVHEIIVVDNNSTDKTSEIALAANATVLFEPKKGYGYACLKGMNYIENLANETNIIVFMDGDYSDYPEDLLALVKPILEKNIDFVLGSRVNENCKPGALTPHQRFGNWLATTLMKILFQSRFTDLGPFRAIKYDILKKLDMRDTTYGWTIEMQLKILRGKWKYEEIPVKYRERIGTSKVSGTIKGSIFAGIKILSWIFKYSFKKCF